MRYDIWRRRRLATCAHDVDDDDGDVGRAAHRSGVMSTLSATRLSNDGRLLLSPSAPSLTSSSAIAVSATSALVSSGALLLIGDRGGVRSDGCVMMTSEGAAVTATAAAVS